MGAPASATPIVDAEVLLPLRGQLAQPPGKHEAQAASGELRVGERGSVVTGNDVAARIRAWVRPGVALVGPYSAVGVFRRPAIAALVTRLRRVAFGGPHAGRSDAREQENETETDPVRMHRELLREGWHVVGP